MARPGQGPARRIMRLVSDGEENRSRKTMDTTISEALEADAAIYSVNVNDEDVTDESKQGDAILKRLAEATGGAYLDDRGHDVANAFGKIRRELRSQYALAYKLSNPSLRTFHHLQVFGGRSVASSLPAGCYVRVKVGYRLSGSHLSGGKVLAEKGGTWFWNRSAHGAGIVPLITSKPS